MRKPQGGKKTLVSSFPKTKKPKISNPCCCNKNIRLTFECIWIVLQVVQPLFEFARHRQDLAAAVFLDPLLDFGQPLATLADEILLRQIDDVDLGLRR
jgi:hypothetical protein